MSFNAPIELIFYDDKDQPEQTFTRSRIPSFLLDSAINLQKEMTKGGETNTDAIFNFVVEFYGGKFTLEELKQKTDLTECLNVIRAVIARASALTVEFAQANPRVPSPKKK